MARPLPQTINVLALDTASPSPSVTLLWNGALFSEELSTDRRASEELLPAIQRLLANAGAELARCDRIAVCSGPGSFTGLRIGMATAWGLARGAEVPVEAVSTLEALAESVRDSGAQRVAAALDAGRGEVVFAVFALDGPRAEIVEPPERLLRGEAARRCRSVALAATPETLLETPSLPIRLPLSVALARAVARSPRPGGPLEATAIYSRPSAAEEKRGAA